MTSWAQALEKLPVGGRGTGGGGSEQQVAQHGSAERLSVYRCVWSELIGEFQVYGPLLAEIQAGSTSG